MKPSAAMLKGWEAVGKQCYGDYAEYLTSNVCAVCAMGAANLAITGDPCRDDGYLEKAYLEYQDFYGVSISSDNDINKLTIPQIAARLEAIGY